MLIVPLGFFLKLLKLSDTKLVLHIVTVRINVRKGTRIPPPPPPHANRLLVFCLVFC